MTRTAKYMGKINQYGPDAAFVANVVMNQHSAPVTKLRNLASLLEAGYRIRTAQFSIDTLLVNDQQIPWNSLDTLTGVLDVVNPKYSWSGQ